MFSKVPSSIAAVCVVSLALLGCGGSSSSKVSSSANATALQSGSTQASGQRSGTNTSRLPSVTTGKAHFAPAPRSTHHSPKRLYGSSTPPTPPPPRGSTGGTKLKLEANPNGEAQYNTKSLIAKAGRVTIDFRNMSSQGHNVTIESSTHQKLGLTPTFRYGMKVLSLILKPGTYTFYSSVPGDRTTTEGTLTVK